MTLTESAAEPATTDNESAPTTPAQPGARPGPTGEKIPAVEALVKILIQEGVEFFFGIPGSHTCPLFDEIDRSGKIKVILPRHEQGAAYMADGYARVARRLAVCTGTVGPGATNLITGIAASYADGIPILVLTGGTSAAGIGRSAHQEATGIGRTPNQVELFRNVTKASFAANRASQVPQLLRTALRVALTERFGPVNLTLPPDVHYDRIPYQNLEKQSYRVRRSDNVDLELVRQAAEIVRGARRPVLLAGQRSLLPDATRQIHRLADRFNIPVITPLNAKGAIDEHHPMALGCLGLLGQRSAEKYLREIADVVIAVGENFEELMSLSWDPEIVADKKLIHIDVDPLEIGKNYPVTIGIDGTIRRILDALAHQLDDLEYAPVVTVEEIEALKREWDYFEAPEVYSDAVPIKPQRVMRELRAALPLDTIVFGDSGHTVRWFGRYFKSTPQSFYAANIFEPMGYSVGACIGGKLAAPKRPVVSICGDGSFLMNGIEISTAVHYDLPVLWIVLNDSRLNMVYHTQSVYYDRHVATTFRNPDYRKFAEAFGGIGFQVERPQDIRPAVHDALASGKPAIVDIHIDADEIPPMRARSLIVGKEMRLPQPKANRASVQALTKMMREK